MDSFGRFGWSGWPVRLPNGEAAPLGHSIWLHQQTVQDYQPDYHPTDPINSAYASNTRGPFVHGLWKKPCKNEISFRIARCRGPGEPANLRSRLPGSRSNTCSLGSPSVSSTVRTPVASVFSLLEHWLIPQILAHRRSQPQNAKCNHGCQQGKSTLQPIPGLPKRGGDP